MMKKFLCSILMMNIPLDTFSLTYETKSQQQQLSVLWSMQKQEFFRQVDKDNFLYLLSTVKYATKRMMYVSTNRN